MADRRVIAMDTESVGVGPGGKKSAVAQVSLVDRTSGRTLNAYIRRKGITDYRTKFSGLTKQILRNGQNFMHVKRKVLNFLGDDDIILVGHSLHHDLRGLGIAPTFDIRDTSTYWRFKNANNGKTPGLKFLAERFLKRKIRVNGRHSCVEDAKTALQLYELVEREWEAEIRANQSEYEDSDSEYDSESNSEYDSEYGSEYDSYSDPGFEDYGPFALNNDFW